MAFDWRTNPNYTNGGQPATTSGNMPVQASGNFGKGYIGADTGYPANPNFKSLLDDSGNLLEQYKVKAGASLMPKAEEGIGRSRSLMDLLKGYATGETGSSPWAQAQMNALELDAGEAMGNVGAQANAASRAAASGAASRGGLSSAMRMNLARNTQNQMLNAKQGVAGQRLKGRAGIMAGDADRQMGVLSQLPGMENATTGLWANIASGDRNYQTGVDQFNQGAAMGGVRDKNQFDLGMYEQDVKRQAGKEMADATANSGKK
jgi:hypothetical protein